MKDDGTFEPDELTRAEQWISEHWKQNLYCPICTAVAFQMSPNAVNPLTFSPKGLQLGGKLYPLVLITCTSCGYTMHFNAAVMGIVGPNKSAADEPSEIARPADDDSGVR